MKELSSETKLELQKWTTEIDQKYHEIAYLKAWCRKLIAEDLTAKGESDFWLQVHLASLEVSLRPEELAKLKDYSIKD